jgi:hypothetical protein
MSLILAALLIMLAFRIVLFGMLMLLSGSVQTAVAIVLFGSAAVGGLALVLLVRGIRDVFYGKPVAVACAVLLAAAFTMGSIQAEHDAGHNDKVQASDSFPVPIPNKQRGFDI